MSEPTEATTDGKIVISQPVEKRSKLLSRKWVILAGLVLLIVLGFVIYSYANRPTAPKYFADPNAPADFHEMTASQAVAKLYVDTGLDAKALQTKKLNSRTFKDFTAAYHGALTFEKLQDYKQAFAAYQIADAKVDKNTTYAFYLDFASAADNQGNSAVTKQAIDKAIAAIKADKSLSENRKTDMIDKIQSKARLGT